MLFGRLFLSQGPVSEETIDELPDDYLTLLIEKAGLTFVEQVDVRYGEYYNFKVGMTGDVGASEEDMLWPNEASFLHTFSSYYESLRWVLGPGTQTHSTDAPQLSNCRRKRDR